MQSRIVLLFSRSLNEKHAVEISLMYDLQIELVDERSKRCPKYRDTFGYGY